MNTDILMYKLYLYLTNIWLYMNYSFLLLLLLLLDIIYYIQLYTLSVDLF